MFVTGSAPPFEHSYNLLQNRPLVRIPINFTSEDQNILKGSLCLALYVGVWLLSVISVPATLILLILGYLKIGVLLISSMICCLTIPVKPWQPLRVWARSNLGRYFKEASIRFEHVPDRYNDRPTILSVHPHGVFSLAWAQCYLTDELHHIYFCFSTLLNLSPFLKLVIRLTGYSSNVRKKTIKEHMRKGHSIAIIPGGWHEATIHNHNVDRIYIRERTGFIKYAVQYGYTITPCYAFGERSTYANVQGCYKFRFWLNGFGILGVIPWGRTCFPMCPRDSKLHIVVAEPVQLPYISNPTPEDVEKAHKLYVAAVIDLYNAYKVKFYGEQAENMSLELW